MKISKSTSTDSGYAMLLALGFMLIMLILLASMMKWSNQNAVITLRNNQYVASQYAAEAAVESVVSQMSHDFYSQTLSNASYYATFIPTNTGSWPIQYQFNNPLSLAYSNQVYVFIGDSSTNLVPLSSPFDGLWAAVQQCTVAATATPIGQRYNVPATVTETFQLASIPICQFAIYYNSDINLEINAAQAMTINGRVFSGGGLWSGDNITFNSSVWSVDKAQNGGTDPYANYPRSGGTSGSTYKLAGQPLSGVKLIYLPVAGADTNSDPAVYASILQLPPAAYAMGSPAAYSGDGQIYLANESDLVISNAASGISSTKPSGTNFTAYYQDSYYSYYGNPLLPVPYDYYIITNKNGIWLTTNYVATNLFAPGNTNIQYAGYTFLTNVVFYDWREYWNNGSGNGGKGKMVQAVQFDVAAFNAWLANTNLNGTTNLNGGKSLNTLCQSPSHKSHTIDGIYIYNSVVSNQTTLPAVRVTHGRQLYDKYGLSIATPFPLYVQGDYNVTDGSGISDAGKNITTHTFPAAFFADSITILSANFNDNNHQKAPSVNPSITTINAACLEGIVPSDKSLGRPNDDSDYSGGVENFLRLLESWGTLYYNGSIMVMFPSQYATGRWRQTGNYYGAPTRHWAFDTNYLIQAKLPPMMPQIKTDIRGSWTVQ